MSISTTSSCAQAAKGKSATPKPTTQGSPANSQAGDSATAGATIEGFALLRRSAVWSVVSNLTLSTLCCALVLISLSLIIGPTGLRLLLRSQ
ncbi:uncharacterized protein B0I36DRAFT_340797 [Microdochium trichocladiopsis]|uniref:Uncharacterized protein n=1 Tax=Microdochium trichocladiopsis TaxID=1682393 RepID=A0A9P9BIK8_9PEZI|nr:uncharacterized protein B0I36DRAFT_340797 [Microdochium trichocladiopsis]KAH7012272.1 hypothetical protein B0I36DRAFT_340797 [Microdochium trichocladiopsis]